MEHQWYVLQVFSNYEHKIQRTLTDRIEAASNAGLGDFYKLPAALNVVLENLLRFEDGKTVDIEDIEAFSDWAKNGGKTSREIAYRPARVLMQDFEGVCIAKKSRDRKSVV